MAFMAVLAAVYSFSDNSRERTLSSASAKATRAALLVKADDKIWVVKLDIKSNQVTQ